MYWYKYPGVIKVTLSISTTRCKAAQICPLLYQVERIPYLNTISELSGIQLYGSKRKQISPTVPNGTCVVILVTKSDIVDLKYPSYYHYLSSYSKIYLPEIRESGHEIEFNVRAVRKPVDLAVQLLNSFGIISEYFRKILHGGISYGIFAIGPRELPMNLERHYSAKTVTSPIFDSQLSVELRSAGLTGSWYEVEIRKIQKYKEPDPFKFIKPTIREPKKVSWWLHLLILAIYIYKINVIPNRGACYNII